VLDRVSTYEVDIRDADVVGATMARIRPEIAFLQLAGCDGAPVCHLWTGPAAQDARAQRCVCRARGARFSDDAGRADTRLFSSASTLA
jgi:hypothetical protein